VKLELRNSRWSALINPLFENHQNNCRVSAFCHDIYFSFGMARINKEEKSKIEKAAF
jgi:hypothetical protein